jgi:hypothetical protein
MPHPYDYDLTDTQISRGRIGGAADSGGAKLSAPPGVPGSLENAFKHASGMHDKALAIAAAVGQIADKVYGSRPEACRDATEEYQTGSIGELAGALNRLDAAISDIGDQVSRLSSL